MVRYQHNLTASKLIAYPMIQNCIFIKISSLRNLLYVKSTNIRKKPKCEDCLHSYHGSHYSGPRFQIGIPSFCFIHVTKLSPNRWCRHDLDKATIKWTNHFHATWAFFNQLLLRVCNVLRRKTCSKFALLHDISHLMTSDINHAPCTATGGPIILCHRPDLFLTLDNPISLSNIWTK